MNTCNVEVLVLKSQREAMIKQKKKSLNFGLEHQTINKSINLRRMCTILKGI